MKPTMYAVALVVGILMVMWAAAGNKPEAKAATTSVRLAKSDFDTLSHGMTKPEVCAMLGSKECDSEHARTPAGVETERCYWKDKHGSVVYLRFTNGKLSEKLDGRFH